MAEDGFITRSLSNTSPSRPLTRELLDEMIENIGRQEDYYQRSPTYLCSLEEYNWIMTHPDASNIRLLLGIKEPDGT